MTATYDARIAARRTTLTKLRAERQDEETPRTLTLRAFREHASETAQLDATILRFESKVAAWAALPTLDADAAWLSHLNAWRTTLSDELLTIKSPIRDKDTKARADGLTFSIRLIDFGFGAATLPIATLAPTRIGQLMVDAGYETEGSGLHGPCGWRGSLKEVEQRIKALTKQRSDAQAALDAALMTDEERAEQEAEDQALRDAFNALHVRIGHDGRLVAYDEDGAELDASKMTPLQRKAIERMDGPREAASS